MEEAQLSGIRRAQRRYLVRGLLSLLGVGIFAMLVNASPSARMAWYLLLALCFVSFSYEYLRATRVRCPECGWRFFASNDRGDGIFDVSVAFSRHPECAKCGFRPSGEIEP